MPNEPDYLVVRFDLMPIDEVEEMQNDLNELALQGWRLVSTAGAGTQIYAFLERPRDAG